MENKYKKKHQLHLGLRRDNSGNEGSEKVLYLNENKRGEQAAPSIGRPNMIINRITNTILDCNNYAMEAIEYDISSARHEDVSDQSIVACKHYP